MHQASLARPSGHCTHRVTATRPRRAGHMGFLRDLVRANQIRISLPFHAALRAADGHIPLRSHDADATRTDQQRNRSLGGSFGPSPLHTGDAPRAGGGYR